MRRTRRRRILEEDWREKRKIGGKRKKEDWREKRIILQD